MSLSDAPRWQLTAGDMRDVLQRVEENRFHACVCDPPYHLTSITKRFGKKGSAAPDQRAAGGAFSRLSKGFMGAHWDGGAVAFDPATWEAVYRVLRPGAYLFAFGGARTHHRMAVAIEDAGFILQGEWQWWYGQGWPKSHNLKDEWEGWGGGAAATKPMHEPIIFAQKPLAEGNIRANVNRWGVGALNIDGCRIHTAGSEARPYTAKRLKPGATLEKTGGAWQQEGVPYVGQTKAGRWPGDVLLSHSLACEDDRCADDCPVALLDEQSGISVSRIGKPRAAAQPGLGWGFTKTGAEYDDAGGASRFCYIAKPSRAERDAGLDALPLQVVDVNARHRSRRMEELKRPDGADPALGRNEHATVKPITLLTYLTRYVCPPNGEVLDPFCGSGSEGAAALLEGFRYFGIELCDGSPGPDGEPLPDYVDLARRRLTYWEQEAARLRAAAEQAARKPHQLDMAALLAAIDADPHFAEGPTA